MKTLPITCEKCFLDFQESLDELQELIRIGKQQDLNEKSQKRIIRSFEITHELALKTIEEYFKKMGRPAFSGPRDATIEAFNEDLIDDGKGWLDMIIERIKYDPIYAEIEEKELTQHIIHKYLLLFNNFERHMKENLEGI